MNAYTNTKVAKEVAPESGATHKILLIETPSAKAENQLYDKLASQKIELINFFQSTDDLISQVELNKPDILVLSVDFLDAATLEQLIKIHDTCPLPVAVFAKQHSPQVLKTVISAGVSSYVVDDAQAHRLSVIIDLAIARFEQMNSLSSELEQTKEKLNDRKLIERAKGILMQQKNLSEEDAYSQMRKSAMNQGQSIADLSRKIISVFDILDKA